MTSPTAEEQLFRLASDNPNISEDARNWFVVRGASIAQVLVTGLEDSSLGSVCHWRILLILRELGLASTLPAILKAFTLALERKDAIVLPGALEALAVFHTDQAVSALALVLQEGMVDDVKHAAALLGNMGDSRAVAPLAALLKHQDSEIRGAAVRSLLKFDTLPASQALESHRQHEKDPGVLALINSKLRN
jgi:HEAT repeat protein